MRRGVFFQGRDAHQPLDGEPERIAAMPQQRFGLAHGDAGLLRLVAGVHLDEQLQHAAGARHFVRDRIGDFRPIYGLDGVEQRHRVAGLVGLQRPDQMQLDVREALAQRGPFALGLLHAVLAEGALASLDDGEDVLGAEGLAHRDEVDVTRIAAGVARRRFDAAANRPEPCLLLLHHVPPNRIRCAIHNHCLTATVFFGWIPRRLNRRHVPTGMGGKTPTGDVPFSSDEER
jgi:hypothetical protein